MAKTQAAAPAAYVILHSLVGVHFAGEVVDFSGTGIDMQRLVDAEAVRPATSDDGEAVPYGQTSADLPKPFPAVPFQRVIDTPAEKPVEAPAE